jgi:hypothetical protein
MKSRKTSHLDFLRANSNISLAIIIKEGGFKYSIYTYIPRTWEAEARRISSLRPALDTQTDPISKKKKIKCIYSIYYYFFIGSSSQALVVLTQRDIKRVATCKNIFLH